MEYLWVISLTLFKKILLSYILHQTFICFFLSSHMLPLSLSIFFVTLNSVTVVKKVTFLIQITASLFEELNPFQNWCSYENYLFKKFLHKNNSFTFFRCIVFVTEFFCVEVFRLPHVSWHTLVKMCEIRKKKKLNFYATNFINSYNLMLMYKIDYLE